jgi:CheY-like chemotaxis protein
VEHFDAADSLVKIVELMNLAGGEEASRIALEAPSEAEPMRQDRQAVEQVLSRILNAAMKLAPTGKTHISIGSGSSEDSFRFTIKLPEPDLAMKLLNWLNADPDQVNFLDGEPVMLAVAMIVAGRRLQILGGTAELGWPTSEGCTLAIALPSQPEEISTPNFLALLQDSGPDSLNILVAEDCDESYALSELLLQKENVYRARNGPEALDIVQKHRFDVVFMDVHMPGMDGYATIRAIRDWETQTANARTVIVLLSSDDIATQKRLAAQSGCSGFLKKPLRNSDLAGLLQRLKLARASAALMLT